MKTKIPKDFKRKLIEKLKGLPASSFREANSRNYGMPPHSVSGTDVNEYPYCHYDSKNNQLFCIVSSHWTMDNQDMAGETESKSGVDYHLRVYSGNRITEDPNFEFSGREVERLYQTIGKKLEEAQEDKERRKRMLAKKKLRRFIGE